MASSSEKKSPVTNAVGSDRAKALDSALAQIELMRLGDEGRAPIEVIPTGSIALDLALGHRRSAARPRRRDLRPGVLGQDHRRVARDGQRAARNGGIAAFIDAEHALDPEYAANSASTSMRCW
jgi:recombination protein RecA